MSTQVILLERVSDLGQMGDVVSVRPGYARNFLLPQKKALRATKDNIAYFERQKQQLQADSAKQRAEAEKQAAKMDNVVVSIIRQAAEGGQLFGSVSTRDIADALAVEGFVLDRRTVELNQSFKTIGLFPVMVALHPDVKVKITVNIARSEEEAKLQKKTGKALVAEDAREAKLAAAKADIAARDALLEEGVKLADDAEDSEGGPSAKSERRAARKATKAAKAGDAEEGAEETAAEGDEEAA